MMLYEFHNILGAQTLQNLTMQVNQFYQERVIGNGSPVKDMDVQIVVQQQAGLTYGVPRYDAFIKLTLEEIDYEDNE
jgi:hypothetical protein